MFDSLRSLSDDRILSDTDAIVAQDRKITLRLLVHLHEIERRKLYLKRGYRSMFDYCTRHLRLPEPGAVRRLKTARCLARFPELYALLESGDVNLTTVSIASRILNPDNASEIIARIRGKSKREVEAVVAEQEPCALLPPDSVRTVVVPVVQKQTTSDKKFTVSGDGKESSTGAVEERESESAPQPSVKLERRALVRFTAREEVLAKLNRVRAVASHQLRGGASFDEIIELLADDFLERHDPIVRHERRERRNAGMKKARAARRSPSQDARAIPAAVRDEVFARDENRCTFVSPAGRRCDSTHLLQIDHRIPVARGGKSTIDNLRLLCAHHNRMEAERLMGRNGPPVPPGAANVSSP